MKVCVFYGPRERRAFLLLRFDFCQAVDTCSGRYNQPTNRVALFTVCEGLARSLIVHHGFADSPVPLFCRPFGIRTRDSFVAGRVSGSVLFYRQCACLK